MGGHRERKGNGERERGQKIGRRKGDGEKERGEEEGMGEDRRGQG